MPISVERQLIRLLDEAMDTYELEADSSDLVQALWMVATSNTDPVLASEAVAAQARIMNAAGDDDDAMDDALMYVRILRQRLMCGMARAERAAQTWRL